jgi:trimeric autotransporter adhesin
MLKRTLPYSAAPELMFAPQEQRHQRVSPHHKILMAIVLAVISAAGVMVGNQIAVAGGAGDISTVIGGPGTGQGTSVAQCVSDVGLDSSGNIYSSDTCFQVVREYVESTGVESVVAGAGNPSQGGFTGDAGPATSAELNSPAGVAVDSNGNLIIVDAGNNRVRVVAGSTASFYGISMTSGDIYTVAGGASSVCSGHTDSVGDGCPATQATLSTPTGVAVDANGNVLIADTGNNRIRVVAVSTGTFYGISMTSGDIYTIAGNGTAGSSGDTGAATSAELNGPNGVATDSAGNVVIGDSGNNKVRVVAEATGTYYAVAMTTGDIYTVAGTGTAGFSGDTGAAISAELHDPTGVSIDGGGNIVITDTGNERIRVVPNTTGTYYSVAMTTGDIYTVAGGGSSGLGDGGAATSAELSSPGDAVADSNGNLLIADYSDRRVRVVADSTGSFYGISMTAGDIYTIEGTGTVYYSGDGGPAASAEIGASDGIAVDSAGDEFVSDTLNSRLRMVPASSGTNYGITMTAGDIYTVAGGATSLCAGHTDGLGDSCPSTQAYLDFPGGSVLDSHGNLIIADTSDCVIRAVAASNGTYFGVAMTAGDIYTIAGDVGSCGDSSNGTAATSAKLDDPDAVAIDGNGNLVIADTSGCYIKVVADVGGSFYNRTMTADHMYDVAGNGTCGNNNSGTTATSSKVNDPSGIAIDGSGNLVIGDTAGQYIKVVAESTATFYGVPMTVNKMYDVAGTGSAGFSGDNGASTSAALDNPWGVAVDSSGNIAIGDETNYRVRVIADSTGTYYGISMTAGDIYTVAGDGTNGFAGDGGAATSAELYDPRGVAVDSSGDLFIADYANDRIREVQG